MRPISILSPLLQKNQSIVIDYEGDIWKLRDIGNFTKILPDSLNYTLELTNEESIIELPFTDVKTNNPSYPLIFLLNIIEGNLKDFSINPSDNEIVATAVSGFVDRLQQKYIENVANFLPRKSLIVDIE